MIPGRQPPSCGLPARNHVTWLSHSRSRRLTAVALFVVVGTVCLLALAGAGSAAVTDGQYAHGDGSDTTPPTVANGTRINDTAIAVTIADNHDVDESTIEPSDFLLSHGSVRTIGVAEDGSDATVTLRLTRRLDRDDVTVVIRSGETILDADGNVLNASATDSFAVVSGMDGVPPSLRDFSVSNATGGPATVRLEAQESLSEFELVVRGPEDDSLNRSDFESADGGRSWEMTYRPPADGIFDVYLSSMTDEAGNTRDSSRSRRFIADLTPPTAIAGLDLASSENLSIAFDASQSRDSNGIDQHRWAFGDGNSATGARVTHQFRPGNYTVVLNVTDIYGNSATDSVTLNVTRGSGDVGSINETQLRDSEDGELNVSVDRRGGVDSTDAFVGVENARRSESVAAGTLAGDSALAAHGPVSLDGLALTVGANRSFDLGISMAGTGSVTDATAATSATPLAGFTVVNTIPDDELSNVTVRFGVTRERLQELGASPANVSLYRYHDGGWNAVPTSPLTRTNTTQSFGAEPPGFSRFAVAATVPTSPRVTVSDVTPETDRVAPGEPFAVTATLTNDGDAVGTYTAGLTANGTVVSTNTTTVPAGETTAVELRSQTTDEGTYGLSVNRTDAGTLVVTEAAKSGDQNGSDTPENGSTATERLSPGAEFVVTNATLGSSQVDVDEIFTVEATVENRGDRPGNYTAGLIIDGNVAVTEAVPVAPGESTTVSIDYLLNRTGEFAVSINGTMAGTLTVGNTTEDSDSSGGGGPLGVLAGLFGILPLGLLRTVFLFVILPLGVVYGVLKGIAVYLGY